MQETRRWFDSKTQLVWLASFGNSEFRHAIIRIPNKPLVHLTSFMVVLSTPNDPSNYTVDTLTQSPGRFYADIVRAISKSVELPSDEYKRFDVYLQMPTSEDHPLGRAVVILNEASGLRAHPIFGSESDIVAVLPLQPTNLSPEELYHQLFQAELGQPEKHHPSLRQRLYWSSRICRDSRDPKFEAAFLQASDRLFSDTIVYVPFCCYGPTETTRQWYDPGYVGAAAASHWQHDDPPEIKAMMLDFLYSLTREEDQKRCEKRFNTLRELDAAGKFVFPFYRLDFWRSYYKGELSGTELAALFFLSDKP